MNGYKLTEVSDKNPSIYRYYFVCEEIKYESNGKVNQMDFEIKENTEFPNGIKI